MIRNLFAWIAFHLTASPYQKRRYRSARNAAYRYAAVQRMRARQS